jgi:hypothetical protein
VSGEVPQQPPTMLTRPERPSRRSSRPAAPAFRRSRRRRWAGRHWGGPRRSNRRRATVPRRTGAVPWRPSAQLRPKLSGWMWFSEFQKASAVWPDSVRPEASVMVPEIITGQRRPVVIEDASRWRTAPPWRSACRRRSRPAGCRRRLRPGPDGFVIVATSSSKLTLRKPGSLTSGEIDAVREVGPSTPATKRGLAGLAAVNSSHTAARQLAPATLSSWTDALQAVIGLRNAGRR